ncbi:paramyosin-like [Salvia splendens]|uniref:paramyosin-like n=1 Tax=Salvia splendens TaxID=180675 RepID=UPI001105306B|nr:paramyosin-like [Salvia splendens]
MATSGDDENDTVLSDVEADDPVPIVIQNPDDVSVEKFKEILAELDRERTAREAAENAKNDMQVSFNRLKALCHEAIKKRDECSRQRDEALRDKEEALKNLERVGGDLSEEVKLTEEISRQKDEVSLQLEEVGKARDSIRVEIEKGSSMLVSGIEKISRKVSSYKDFGANGLPKSNKYSGLPAVAYGVIKRTNEIVEELLRQVESSIKGRNEARELVEQRNYEIAIEVSQLEAAISGLREEVAKKSEEIESLKKSLLEKDGKVAELERESMEKQEDMEGELSRLRLLISDYEWKMEMQRPLLIDQLNYVTRLHEEMCKAMEIVDANKSSELSESLFLAQETNMEENIRASLEGMESVYELSKIVVEKTKDQVEERTCEVKKLNETVSQLINEKEQIGSLLRSTLTQRMSVDMSSKTNKLFKVAENGLKEAGIDYKFSKFDASKGKAGPDDTDDNEVYALASALENIIKQSQIEIIELKHSVEELRAESNSYKECVDAQAKELIQWKQRVEELEEKERVANENVEGLMMDIAGAEEEIMRWKVAAQQEADAGKAVEQEYISQLASVRQELEEARQAVIESKKKLKFKEETAEAAMAARDAAEKSLRLADTRASRLRDRVEELTRQLDELDTREASRTTSLNRPRYVCWPWQWLGLDYVGSHRSELPVQTANEMELSEPLI